MLLLNNSERNGQSGQTANYRLCSPLNSDGKKKSYIYTSLVSDVSFKSRHQCTSRNCYSQTNSAHERTTSLRKTSLYRGCTLMIRVMGIRLTLCIDQHILFVVRSTPVLPQWHVKDPAHSDKSAGGRFTPKTRYILEPTKSEWADHAAVQA